MSPSSLVTLILSSLLLVACSSDDPTGSPVVVDKRIESQVTVARGVYGLAYSVEDVGVADEAALPGFKVSIEAMGASDPVLVDSAFTNERGVYQKELGSGAYRLCTSFGRCTTVVVADQAVRCDYEYSAGPGWQCP